MDRILPRVEALDHPIEPRSVIPICHAQCNLERGSSRTRPDSEYRIISQEFVTRSALLATLTDFIPARALAKITKVARPMHRTHLCEVFRYDILLQAQGRTVGRDSKVQRRRTNEPTSIGVGMTTTPLQTHPMARRRLAPWTGSS